MRESRHFPAGHRRMLKLRHTVLVISLLLACVGAAWGQSQQPSPSPGKGIEPPPSQTAQSSTNPATDRRGTEQSPLIIKVLPTPESAEKVAVDAKRENQKVANDERIARFTELLFWATVALSVIAGFQLLVFGWQGIQLSRTVAVTKESADAAALSARAVIGVELPIIIFKLELNKEPGRHESPVTGFPRKTSTLIVNFWNRGRSAAEMITFCVEWRVISSLPEKAIFENVFQYAPGDVLETNGDPSMKTIVINLQDEEVESIEKETKSLWVYGYLSYKDFLGTLHQTSIVPNGALMITTSLATKCPRDLSTISRHRPTT